MKIVTKLVVILDFDALDNILQHILKKNYLKKTSVTIVLHLSYFQSENINFCLVSRQVPNQKSFAAF